MTSPIVTPMREKALERIKDLMIEIHADRAQVEALTEASDIREDVPSLDSLDHVELIMGIEDTYSIEIPDKDVTKARTVGDLIDIIGRLAF
jgi:acyl carrier protein